VALKNAPSREEAEDDTKETYPLSLYIRNNKNI
jgi:hypothetical protein